jgi:hypothetical protein
MEEDSSLFILGEDSHNNACLNFLDDMSYGYIQGYLRTGEILADYINEKGVEQDMLIYPLLFSYRHHMCLLDKREAIAMMIYLIHLHDMQNLK